MKLPNIFSYRIMYNPVHLSSISQSSPTQSSHPILASIQLAHPTQLATSHTRSHYIFRSSGQVSFSPYLPTISVTAAMYCFSASSGETLSSTNCCQRLRFALPYSTHIILSVEDFRMGREYGCRRGCGTAPRGDKRG